MRRHLFALFGGIALLATLVPAGSAAWMFALEEAMDSANVLVQGDPIRDNHVLGDDNDPDYAGQTFYDVYFAAQVTPATSQISDRNAGSQILSRDQSSFSTAYPCYGGVGASSGESKLGRFENPSQGAPPSGRAPFLYRSQRLLMGSSASDGYNLVHSYVFVPGSPHPRLPTFRIWRLYDGSQ